MIYEPEQDKTNKTVYVPSEDSNQPKHPTSMIRFFVLRSMVAKDLRLLYAGSEDAGQTERLPRLTGRIS